MIAYALIITLNVPFELNEKYIGDFINCKVANSYYNSNYKDKKKYNGFKCIRKDLIPKETLETLNIQKGE